jgi:hypothetical protein
MTAGLEWRKSSFSTDDANCVEVAWFEAPVTAVRDSKNTEGPTLAFPIPAWHKFLRAV